MSSEQQNISRRATEVLSGIRAEREETRRRATPGQEVVPARAQMICIASGKGGTGKTMVACNLAVLLARQGLRVTLLDADLGLANAHLLLGTEPRADLSHLLRGERTLQQTITPGPDGVQLIAGGSGRTDLAMMGDADIGELALQLAPLDAHADIILVDLAAGITPQVVRFLNAAHDIILVSNHEATAQADVMATLRMLAETVGAASVHLVINRARNRDHAVVAFQQLWRRANQEWRGRIKLFFSGWVPHNWYVQSSIIMGKPVVNKHPQSLPTRCLTAMSARIAKHHALWRSRQVGRWGAPSAFARLARMTVQR